MHYDVGFQRGLKELSGEFQGNVRRVSKDINGHQRLSEGFTGVSAAFQGVSGTVKMLKNVYFGRLKCNKPKRVTRIKRMRLLF